LTISTYKQLSGWEKAEIGFFVALGFFFITIGYIGNDLEAQQWGVILVLIGFVFFLGYREFSRPIIHLPNQQLEAYSHVIKLLCSAEQYLKLIDLYPGELALKAISAVPKGLPIKWLTMRLYDKEKQAVFEALALRLIRARPEIEIRYAPIGKLHDRYILTDPFGWALGQSIKDIGNKLGSIHPLTVQGTLDIVKVFDDVWEESDSIDEDISSRELTT